MGRLRGQPHPAGVSHHTGPHRRFRQARDAPLTEGGAQGKNYAGKLAILFAYATNGQGIYAMDMQSDKEAEIATYTTPDEL